jgi:WD40 repeat protein
VLDAPELWRVNLPLSTYNMWARFTPDASRVVLLGCEEGQGFARTYLATTGELDREVELGQRCLDHLFGNGILSEFTHDGEIMIIAEHNPFAPTASDSSITRIDFRTGQVTQVAFPDGASGALLSMDLSPTSNRLAAINSAGEVYHWTFPDMTPLESLGRAGLLSINPRTYMPSTESPIQFSPDGSLLAHIDLEKNIVVVDAHTQELRYRLDLSQFSREDITHNGNIGSEVVDLVFTDDGQSLIARLAFGLVAYRCADSIDPQGRDNLSVLLDVPGDLHVGQPVELTATHLDASHFHGHAFFIDGVLLTTPTTGRHAQWTPTRTGTYEVTVQLIDGVHTGFATRFVHVMP